MYFLSIGRKPTTTTSAVVVFLKKWLNLSMKQNKNYYSVTVNQTGKIKLSKYSISTTTTKMKNTTTILSDLRKLMKELPGGGTINAYIVPSDDAHQSEYICESDERRAFVSGFDGSAGTAVVTLNEALLWTDGRYYQQAAQQLDSNWTLMKDQLPTTPSIERWLVSNLKAGDKVGVDPNLMACRTWNTINQTLDNADILMVPVEENLIDLIWKDQPAATSNKIIALDTKISGKTIGDKVNEIRAQMIERGTEVLVVTALDEIAWLLNMRGTDISYNPVFFSFVFLTLNDLYFCVDSKKLPDNYQKHFTDNNINVTIDKYSNAKTVLKKLVAEAKSKIWISLSSSYALTAIIPDRKRHQEVTSICVMKSIKNSVEAEGMRNCHVRDGAALCQYFAWLEQAIKNGEYVTEISGATKLEEFRKKTDKFMGLSFTTISGSGPNGSVIHYHPREETNRQITSTEIYLCDSGAQFLDGTTDVTRTMHFGTPTEYQKMCYTRVLKGQLTLGTTVFPTKVKGAVLDTIARKALWDVGLNYEHGTGHGIGHFLNVHEGPMSVSTRFFPDDPGLQVNMFVSNEPGYYEDGEFGIRIEDIVQIVPANIKNDFAGRGALTFATVTMCPKQTKLIIPDLLTEHEKNTLNAYHKVVFDTLSPIYKQQGDTLTLGWLERETKAI